MGSGAPIVSLQDRLGGHCGLVDRAPTEIDHLLRMPNRPACIGHGGDVAGVRAGDRISGLKSLTHRDICNEAGEAAVANALVFAVPR